MEKYEGCYSRDSTEVGAKNYAKIRIVPRLEGCLDNTLRPAHLGSYKGHYRSLI